MSNVSVETPYAYAFGIALFTFAEELNALQIEANNELTEIVMRSGPEYRQVREKYEFCIARIKRMFAKLNEMTDMATPEEEKVLLMAEYNRLIKQADSLLNKL